MPELAEVEFFRKQWNPGLGKQIISVESHGDKRIFRDVPMDTIHTLLAGSRLMESQARGKQMVFHFASPSTWLGIHLGMTGKLSTGRADFKPGLHDHLILRTSSLSLVLTDPRLFGRIRFAIGKSPPDWWTSLPPDLIGSSFTTTHLSKILQRRARTPLKALLLDQAYFPGIGNWMADEICWRKRLYPGTPSRELTDAQIRSLRNTIRQVCRQALRVIGNGWETPPHSWLFQHRWENGGYCPRCRATLQRDTIRGRTTCWCPKCQNPLHRNG